MIIMTCSILRKKNITGFTLIELLVVISIISLLSSIVFSSLQNAREQTNATALISEMNELNKAMVQYIYTNEGALLEKVIILKLVQQVAYSH